MVRPAEFSDLVRRSVAILKCFFDFGTWSTDAEGPLAWCSRSPATRRCRRSCVPGVGVFQRIFERSVSPQARALDMSKAQTHAATFYLEITDLRRPCAGAGQPARAEEPLRRQMIVRSRIIPSREGPAVRQIELVHRRRRAHQRAASADGEAATS